MSLLLATFNPDKFNEMAELFSPLGVDCVRPRAELPPEENEDSFVGNALRKAQSALPEGLPVLSDDSGLIVPALKGLPGVRSARFARDHARPELSNQALLLEQMRDKEDKTALFHCVLVFLHPDFPGLPLITQGTLKGQLLDAPRGEGGFGYDPIFIPEGESRTFAELPREAKQRLSHRALAAQEMLRALPPFLKKLGLRLEPSPKPDPKTRR